MRYVLTALTVLLVWVILLLYSVVASSHESKYVAVVTSVYDGDSVTLDRQLSGGERQGLWQRGIKTRLLHINAPELRGGTAETKAKGIAARDFLSKWILGKSVVISTNQDEADLYGRLLVEIWLDGVRINDVMVTEGHAVYEQYSLRMPPPDVAWWED